jgi:hypothetical protein
VSADFTRSSHFELFVRAGGVTVKAFIYLSPVFLGKHFTTVRFRSTTRRVRVRLRGLTKAIPGTLQEGGAPFETTHWTVVLQASKTDSDEAARKALATFSEAYWPPLYTFVRRRGYSPADAQDLIQGFFVHLFEQNTLSRADREKGRLRTFLLGTAKFFIEGARTHARN